MKRLILAALLSLITASALADQVRGHYRKDGTYVESYHRSSPNSTKLDNYTTEGNYNPYTLEDGNRSPYTPEPEPTLSRPRRGWK